MALHLNGLISTEDLNGKNEEGENTFINAHVEIDFVKLDAFMFRSKEVICDDEVNYKERYVFNKSVEFHTVEDVIVNGTSNTGFEFDQVLQTVTVPFKCDITNDEIYFAVRRINTDDREIQFGSVFTVIDVIPESITTSGLNTIIVTKNPDFIRTIGLRALIINGLYSIGNFTYTANNGTLTITIEKEITSEDKITLFVYLDKEVEIEYEEETE